MSATKKFPGNIGIGTSREADTKIEKKATRISFPFIADSPYAGVPPVTVSTVFSENV